MSSYKIAGRAGTVAILLLVGATAAGAVIGLVTNAINDGRAPQPEATPTRSNQQEPVPPKRRDLRQPRNKVADGTPATAGSRDAYVMPGARDRQAGGARTNDFAATHEALTPAETGVGSTTVPIDFSSTTAGSGPVQAPSTADYRQGGGPAAAGPMRPGDMPGASGGARPDYLPRPATGTQPRQDAAVARQNASASVFVARAQVSVPASTAPASGSSSATRQRASNAYGTPAVAVGGAVQRTPVARAPLSSGPGWDGPTSVHAPLPVLTPTLRSGSSGEPGGAPAPSGGTYVQTVGNTVIDGAFGSTNVDIQGGTISGSGSISGNVTIGTGGVMNPGTSPGTIEIGGDVQYGNLVIEIAGPSWHDLVDVVGTARFVENSTITFEFIEGFVPGDNLDIEFLRAGMLDGLKYITYAIAGALPPGFQFQVYDDGESDLHVRFFGSEQPQNGQPVREARVPEPSTTALALFGLTMLGWRLRRGPHAARSGLRQ